MVELHRLRVSTIVHHVVASIVTPFGTPISERPPIPTPDERLAEYKERRFTKLHRRELRQKAADGDEAAIEELKAIGLDPSKGVDGRKRQTAGLEKSTGEARTSKKGTVNERARKNKERAIKMETQAGANLLEARELEDEERLGQEILPPTQGPDVRIEGKQ